MDDKYLGISVLIVMTGVMLILLIVVAGSVLNRDCTTTQSETSGINAEGLAAFTRTIEKVCK